LFALLEPFAGRFLGDSASLLQDANLVTAFTVKQLVGRMRLEQPSMQYMCPQARPLSMQLSLASPILVTSITKEFTRTMLTIARVAVYDPALEQNPPCRQRNDSTPDTQTTTFTDDEIDLSPLLTLGQDEDEHKNADVQM
jgi:hypothetical protein